jgi:hypothetical protein
MMPLLMKRPHESTLRQKSMERGLPGDDVTPEDEEDNVITVTEASNMV